MSAGHDTPDDDTGTESRADREPTPRDPREPSYQAPEGAACAQHPERPAAFTCPRCGNYTCVFCFHPVQERCDACLRRDPAAAAPPLPWETQHGSFLQRYVRTLGTAFSPIGSAPAFAGTQLARARSFFLLTALPLALLAGIIPHTKTMLFGGSFSITLQGNPSPEAIALDVLLAMGMQLALFSLDFAALALPYTSLVHAYAVEQRRPAALQLLLYRAWLGPAASLLFFLGMWALPMSGSPEAPPPQLMPLMFLGMVLNALLLVAMRAVARMACGIGTLLSYVVVLVPCIVLVLMQALLAHFMGVDLSGGAAG